MKTILLDLGGVTFQSSGPSNSVVSWEIINSLNDKYGHELNIGAVSVTPFLEEYNALTNQALSEYQFLDSLHQTIEFNEELVSYLTSKYRVVICSDNYRENIDFLARKHNFDQWADGQIYSYDLKHTKYQPGFFNKVVKLLGLAPESLCLIDDSPGKIDNAAKVGIKTILFKTNYDVFSVL